MAKILVVDDDPDITEAIALCLSQAHHTVLTAHSPEEGMKIINKETIDLLVLDIMMNNPDDGITMAQTLRKANFDQPILMLSSINKVTGFTYGKNDAMVPVNEFIEKPVKTTFLIEKVNHLLNKKG